jgi:prolipoprotein diacylglyceryltransferase
MFPILQIGPLALQAPGLMLLLALWLGINLLERFAPKRGISAEVIYNLAFTSLVSGILGARLLFALQNLAVFVESPLSLFSLNPGLLDPFGGFAAALIAALVYGRRKNLGFWPALDALTPLFASLALGVALSNAASGAAFGAETRLPWGVELWGAKRHPTQLYAFGLGLGVLAWLGWKSKDDSMPHGALFLWFVALTASSALFVEAFRGDSSLLPGGFRAAQVLAWLALAAALWGRNRLARDG